MSMDVFSHSFHPSSLPFASLPPFPLTVPTAPLIRISLNTLRTDPAESARLFDASKDLGFFYVDLRDDPQGESLLQDADDLFKLVPEFFDLGREELSKYDYRAQGSYHGYRGLGAAIPNGQTNVDRNEFYNIPKDDFLGLSEQPLAHPQLLHDNQDLVVSYMATAHSLVDLILDHLTGHLHLAQGTLTSKHRFSERSGDQARFIKAPPKPLSEQQRPALGKHTDFGSLTILFNRLGGLQILPPPALVPAGQEPAWLYVKPLPGHCIVNLGDAMVKFTNGLLRSNIHRVVSPPGEQANHTRYSLSYFARAEDQVMLQRLESDVIPKLDGEEEIVSSKDWVNFQSVKFKKMMEEEGKKE